ncbi:MAG: UDP-3-O-(3-hydroxymyristoyl)glucosamine N-acyltransferase [Pseudolabrys sp.]|nr:UDP-3-O-(3-hydroxymyristoyl)glucosamine N-acyltransferase [Pseudolabrys sp.]
MSEPVFLRHSRGLTLDEIVALTGATLARPPAHAPRIVNIGPLDRAAPSELTFFDNRNYVAAAATTHAGACLTTASLAKKLPAHVPALVVGEPYRAFVMVTRELFPHSLRPSSLFANGEATGAHVHPSARLENGVAVDPGAVIGPNAEIGSGTVIGANSVIGAEVRIGRDCSIGAGTILANTLIGDRAIIHPGCKIGQDGFGFVMGRTGSLKVPQVGRVIIQDDVEIGSGTTIDRGAIRDTVIGEGTKIDNLVQVGHNVHIGRHCVLVAQVGIAGSSTLEDFVVLGARVGLNTNVTIGEGAHLAATANVHGDVPAGARWGGTPAKPVKLWFREMTMITRLARKKGGAGPEAATDE